MKTDRKIKIAKSDLMPRERAPIRGTRHIASKKEKLARRHPKHKKQGAYYD